jgi:hypothetical protein
LGQPPSDENERPTLLAGSAGYRRQVGEVVTDRADVPSSAFMASATIAALGADRPVPLVPRRPEKEG